jgi:hypothetical protein
MTPRSKKLLALVTKSTSTRTPGQARESTGMRDVDVRISMRSSPLEPAKRASLCVPATLGFG